MKKRPVLLIILLTLFVLIFSSYINFRMIRIDNLYHNEFKEKLTETVQQEDSFYIKDLTPFNWEKVFIIQPYTSKTMMQEIVGQEWTTYNTYPGYLFKKYILDKTVLGPIEDDLFHKLVFINGDKILLDVTINRSIADFRQIDGIIYFNDLLRIEKIENRYPIILMAN